MNHRNYGLAVTPVDESRNFFRRTGIIMESFYDDYCLDPPETQLVLGRFLTDMWAPVGVEEEVCII